LALLKSAHQLQAGNRRKVIPVVLNILDQPGINHSGELRGFLVPFFYARQIKPSISPIPDDEQMVLM